MRSGWSRLLVVGGLSCGACAAPGSGTRPEGPPSNSPSGDEQEESLDVEESATDEAGEEPGEEPATEAAAGSDSEAAVDLATRMVERECEALCTKADEQCAKAEASRCRDRCQTYVEQSAGCEVAYKAAFRCQANSGKRDLCANVESSACTEPFRRIERCKERLKEEAAKEKLKELPAGWAPITDKQLHFRVALPSSAALDPDAEQRTWRAQDGGVEYVVAQLPAPGKAVTSQVLLKLVLGFVGYSCQKNLKLHGQFEVKDEVAIRFDTQCKDGTEWHGMLRARPDQALATAFRGRLDAGVLEPFIYSYKRLK